MAFSRNYQTVSPRTRVNRARIKGAALAIEWGWQGGTVRRSMVVFVATFVLGAWSSLLRYGSPPEWLGTETFTWVAGGIAGLLIVAALVARSFFGD